MKQEATRYGTEHPSVVPYAAFKTEDSWLVYGATNNRQFKNLLGILGCAEMAEDERFATNDKRIEDREELKIIIDGCFMKKATKEWLEALEGSGMPYGPINSMEECFKHSQAVARDMIQFEAVVDEQLRMVGPPVKFGDTKASIRRRPPLLGEHADEILREAGFDDEKIEWLRANVVV